MGNPLIWLSGAQPQILVNCPTERPKYIGIGSAILITATMACISMTFALHTGLKTPLPLAIPLAVAWGLAIMSLDRWLVVSLKRQDNKWSYLRLATPRVLLALLFGVIISTPVVLQVFEPEIVREISVLQRQNANAYYKKATNDPIAQQIVRDQGWITALEATISNGGGHSQNPADVPAVKALRQARNRASRNAWLDFNRWECEVSGRPGPFCQAISPQLTAASYQSYLSDEALRNKYNAEIGQLEAQVEARNASAAKITVTAATAQLKVTRIKLSKDEAEQKALLAGFNQGTTQKTGLLIRLQALDALAAQSSTVQWARLLLVLFFTTIECLPILVKVLLNLGPENTYEKMLAREEQMHLRVAQEKTSRNQMAGILEAEGITREAQRMLLAWEVARPEITQEAIAATDRVARARLRDWEVRAMRDIAGAHSQSHPGLLARIRQRVRVSRVWRRWLTFRRRDTRRRHEIPPGAPFSPNEKYMRELR